MIPLPCGLLRRESLLDPENNPGLGQIVWGQLSGDLVARENAYVMHAHFSGNEIMHYVPVLQHGLEGCIREVLSHLALLLDVAFLGHVVLLDHWRSLEVSFLQEAFILV